MALAEWIPVTIPRYLVIENVRLGVVLLLMRIGVITYSIYVTWANWDITMYISSGSLVGTQSFTAVSLNPFFPELAFTNPMNIGNEICNASVNAKFNTNYSLTESITVGGVQTSIALPIDNLACIQMTEMMMATKQGSSLFIPTFLIEMEEELIKYTQNRQGTSIKGSECEDHCQKSSPPCSGYLPPTDGLCVCRCRGRQNRVTLGPEAMLISLVHTASSKDKNGKNYVFTSSEHKCQHQGTHDDQKPLKTIVRFQGKIVKRTLGPKAGQPAVWVAPDPIMFWLPELLSWVGINNLDELNHCVKHFNPISSFRLTGVGIHVELMYKNIHDRIEPEEDYDGPICYIEIFRDNVPTVDRVLRVPVGEQLIVPNGLLGYMKQGKAFETMHFGVKIVASVSGDYKWIDYLRLFQTFSAFLVYIAVPTTLLMYFVEYCLGELSASYLKAQCTTVNMERSMSHILMKMLVSIFAFNGLTDNDPSAGITYKQLRQKVEEIFCGAVDVEELDRIASVAFATLSRADAANIDLHSFLLATCQDQGMDLQEIARLYDEKRKKCPTEVCFAPKGLPTPTIDKIKRLKRGTSSQAAEAQPSPEPQAAPAREDWI